MANPNPMANQPATEREPAQATYTPAPRQLMPREMQLERVGNMTSGYTVVYPEVRGGICEYCGVIDGNQPSEFQYKLCGHFRGMQLACSYCPSSKNADDVINHSVLRVMEHPDKPGVIIAHCDSYDCKKKHEERWNIANI